MRVSPRLVGTARTARIHRPLDFVICSPLRPLVPFVAVAPLSAACEDDIDAIWRLHSGGRYKCVSRERARGGNDNSNGDNKVREREA